jgi:CBS-domain-containing membrane protein
LRAVKFIKKIISFPPLIIGLTIALTIALLSFIHLNIDYDISNDKWLLAPFGGSIMLVTLCHAAPIAQPKNIILGHFIAVIVGLIINYLLGSSYISLGIAVGLTASLMMITNSIHPPAGASPIIIILNNITFETALISSMSSSIFLVIFAIIFNSYCLKRQYPV